MFLGKIPGSPVFFTEYANCKEIYRHVNMQEVATCLALGDGWRRVPAVERSLRIQGSFLAAAQHFTVYTSGQPSNVRESFRTHD